MRLITETPVYIYNAAKDGIEKFTPTFGPKEWGVYSSIIRLMMDMNFDKLKQLYNFAKDL